MSPARRLAPASASRHPNLALASITNTSAPNYHFGDGDEEDEDLGNPTTATTTSPSPRTTPYYHDHFDTPTPSPSAFNIRGRPSDDTRTKSPQPEIARWKNGLSPDDGSKPCASDYTDDVKRIILKACGRYEVFIVTENVFPDHDIQSAKAQDYFTEACQTVGAKYEVTDRITGIVSKVVFSSEPHKLTQHDQRSKLGAHASVGLFEAVHDSEEMPRIISCLRRLPRKVLGGIRS